MQVILEENHSSPVISFNALVKVGSAQERNKEAGLSHLIEHMLFKGTHTRPVGAIAREVESSGGEINAYTSFDQTVFYINMATRFSDKGLAILADAIQNPIFDAGELESEKEVILEEMRREKDNPGRMVSELLFRTSYKKHSYGKPIIGRVETVSAFTRNDLIKFYKKWYTPKNISLIVVGDFDEKKAMAQISKVFSGFKGHKPPKFSNAMAEPPQKGMKIIIRQMNVQSTYLAMGYHVPSLVHPEVPALDVLSHILGGAESSRLEQSIKEKKHLVHHISSFSYTPMDPGLLAISAILKEENLKQTLAAIKEEIEKIKNESVFTSELSRAKINIKSGELYERETVGGEASKLATFISCAGTHEFERRYYQILMDLNTESVRQAASRYLKDDNCTISIILPNGSKLKRGEIEHSFKSPARRQKNTAFKKDDETLKELYLKNGCKLIIRENHNLPLVAICAAALGGTKYETPAINGISELASRLITKGTQKRNAITIAREIENTAGYVDGFSGRNTIGLKSKFLSDHVKNGIEIFCDILTNPSFAPHEFENEKRLQIHAIKDQEDALASVAFANFLKTLFPNHPYGLRQLGSIESVSNLTPAKVKKFYKNMIQGVRTTISVVGDVNTNEIKELLEINLKDLKRGSRIRHHTELDPKPREIRSCEVIKKEKQQAHIVLGFQGTTFKDPDRYAMILLNNILVGQGGRLFLELRDKMGLAYSVNSMTVEGTDPGFFAVYIGTEPKKINKAIGGIKNELRKITSELVSKAEIERAKQYIVGTYELESQRAMTLASWYTFNNLYGLGIAEAEVYPQKIISVTRERVLAVSKKFIDLDAYVLTIVRPE